MPNPPPLTLSPEARQACERLTRALVNIAARGLRTHCSQPEIHSWWLSDSQQEREVAARLCRGCPVLEPCREVGQYQRFGVWGSVDRTPRPYKIKINRGEAWCRGSSAQTITRGRTGSQDCQVQKFLAAAEMALIEVS